MLRTTLAQVTVKKMQLVDPNKCTNSGQQNPVLLNLSQNDSWSASDAYEGTIIFGGNGSGKTSGSGRSIARSFLRNGFGGLVLTAKIDEENLWRRYVQECDRDADMIVVAPGKNATLNLLEYESSRPGLGSGLTYELVRTLKTAMEGGHERGKAENPYWEDCVTQLLTNSIDLVRMSSGRVTLDEVMGVIRSLPQSAEDIRTLSLSDAERAAVRKRDGVVWADESLCANLLATAHARTRGTDEARDFGETYAFCTKEWPLLDSRTRSTILSTLMSQLTGLLRTPFRQLFSSSTTVTPEDTFNGKIILLNLPVKEFGDVGRLAQILFKTIWQRAVERRGSYGCPVFLWADEAQFFVSKYDMMFQQTARSSRAASVYLTQSVVNFRASMDSANSTNISDSLLGNLQTKIFHANACPHTNEYAERLFGQELQATGGMSVGAGGLTGNVTRMMLPNLPAVKFTTPRKGGEHHDKIVEGYVFQAGKQWKGDDAKHNKNWLLVPFAQE